MRPFIKRALQKTGELNPAQIQKLLLASSGEIDRLETVLDSLPGGILVCDTSHNLLLANKAARRLLSIVSYEQGSEAVWTVIPDELIAEFLANTFLDPGRAEDAEFYVDINGARRLLNISVMPLARNRNVAGSLVFAEDITERRSRAARLRQMENLASLTTLAAGVAHEIKNPLASLSIHVQLIQKTLAAQEKLCLALSQSEESECKPESHFRLLEKYLGVVNEEVERLNGIVVDFLFAVRPMNAELRGGNINTFISELVEFVSFELKEAGVKCVLNLADNLPFVKFDAGLLKQALLNLIKNAGAAMPGGGELSITTEAPEGEVRIIIADTGTGISEENLAKIFEPYFTTKETGTGLGLTLVFKIIKEHQGDITVKSRKGEGSVFTITLPVPQTAQRLIAWKVPGTF